MLIHPSLLPPLARVWCVVTLRRLAAVSPQYGCLHRRSICDCLIRIDGLVRLLAVEELLDQLLNLRDASRTTDQNNLVDLTLTNLNNQTGQTSKASDTRLSQVVSSG